MEYIKLGCVIQNAKTDRCGDGDYPVLSITKSDGIVLQSDKFKKRIASQDTAQYKIVNKGQLVQGIHIDEANFGIQDIVDAGIVSPAYKIWDVDSSVILPKYLEEVLRSPRSIQYYSSNFNGSIKRRERLSDKDFLAMEIPCPPIEEQSYVLKVVAIVRSIIAHRQNELQKLDELVKARFVELFGDLASPDCKWNAIKLVDACANPDDIKCGPFGTQLNKDEYTDSGVAVWEIPQINSAFKTAPTHFLTEEKAEQLSAYSLVPGDIAMSRKGNVGKCALFPYGYADGIIHSDVLRIRVEQENVNPVFMMCQLHFSGAVTRQIELVSSGAIMAGVNVTKLKQIFVHIPPKDLQDQFAAFVKQVDKSKVVAIIDYPAAG